MAYQSVPSVSLTRGTREKQKKAVITNDLSVIVCCWLFCSDSYGTTVLKQVVRYIISFIGFSVNADSGYAPALSGFGYGDVFTIACPPFHFIK